MPKAPDRAFVDPAVAAAFEAFPPALRPRLTALRRLIFETAEATEGVGPLQETLKWGQPSYLTSETRSGSTVRLGTVKDAPDSVALYFHCQTDLVETFRTLYPDELRYSGKRAIKLGPDDALPEDVLRHCLALALTYHRRKKWVA